MSKFLIHALFIVAAGLSAVLIGLGHWGDAATADEGANYIVKFRDGNEGEFTIHGAKPNDPSAARKTLKDALDVARLLAASATCQVQVINLRTGAEVPLNQSA